MLCLSAAYAIVQYVNPSVCPGVCHVGVFCRNEWTYFTTFSPFTSGRPTILVFPRYGNIPTVTPISTAKIAIFDHFWDR